MKKIILFLLISICCDSFAQQTFIKTSTDDSFGSLIRVLPMDDLGWIVCSLDSMKFFKFNNCGNIEWNRKYLIPNSTPSISDVIKTNDNGIAILTRMQSGSIQVSLVTKLDFNGNILWSKSYEDIYYEQVSYTITEDSQGNLFVYGNTEHTGGSPYYNMIIKINSSGNLIWTYFYNHGGIWGGSITTDDNGLLARTGNTFIKLDNNGNVQWTSVASGNPYYYYAPVEVSDGYIFTGSTSGNNYARFYKIDKLGNPAWTDGKITGYIGAPRALYKRSNGNFAAVFIQGVAGSAYAVEFDKDLNVVEQGASIDATTGVDLYGRDLCFLSDNTPVIVGNTSVGKNIFIAKTDLFYKTNCNVNIIPDPVTLTPFSTSLSSTSKISYAFNEINRNCTFIPYANTTVPLCFYPKVLSIGPDTAFCDNSDLVLKNLTPDIFDHYKWSTGDTTTSVNVNSSGKYWLQTFDDCEQLIFSDTVSITMNPAFKTDLGPDKFICENERLLLKVDCDSCSFIWSTGSIEDTLEVTSKGIYWLQVTNKFGCISSDTLTIDSAKCECDFYLPNAFTPNDDDLNDLFVPVYFCDYASFKFCIYDRWGQLIFESDAMSNGWNGKFKDKLAPEGVYVYSVAYVPIIKGLRKKTVYQTGTVKVLY